MIWRPHIFKEGGKEEPQHGRLLCGSPWSSKCFSHGFQGYFSDSHVCGLSRDRSRRWKVCRVPLDSQLLFLPVHFSHIGECCSSPSDVKT